jgi:hypothetical protein
MGALLSPPRGRLLGLAAIHMHVMDAKIGMLDLSSLLFGAAMTLSISSKLR